jgi:outer membrane protein
MRGEAAGPPATKVGYVNLRKTLDDTKAGQKAKDKLESEKKDKQKQIDEKKTEFQKQLDELDKQRVVLKADVIRQREKELEQKYVALQEYFMQQQQELAKKEASLTNDIFNKAAAIIESIYKRDNYTIILEKTQSAVLFGHESIDITAEVNKRLDAEGK